MRHLASELLARHRGLAAVGAINLTVATVFLLMTFLDSATVLGVNRWIKPFKFAVSVGIYLWTVAWFLPYLSVGKRISGTLGWAIAVLLLFENGLVFTQAIRGVRSHFNFETGLDAAIFGTMGGLILFNTILLVVLLLLFFFRAGSAPRPWIWAIRIGLVVLLLGSAEGAFMIGNGGHSIGATDGGAGLPLIHWNAEAGDLRPAHLIGLHGVQVIPFFAFLLGRSRLAERRQLALLLAFSAAYGLLGALLFWQAIRGVPLLP